MKQGKLPLIGLALVTGLILTGCASSPKAEKVTPGKAIKLSGVVNVRDLGGYQTKDGQKQVKPYRLIRGAELYGLTTEDQQMLTDTYQLKQLIDLRTDQELSEHPDPKIKSVTYSHVPVMKNLGEGASTQAFMENLMRLENPEDYLIEANRNFVTEPIAKTGYKQLFDSLLANEEGATLWHCTAGKDRAGFGTALVLSALGVPKETVMKDYLLSNTFRKKANQQMIQTVAKQTDNNPQAVKTIEAMMEVRESYLEAAFSEMDKTYQGVEGYLIKGLGLSEKDLTQLKQMYLEDI